MGKNKHFNKILPGCVLLNLVGMKLIIANEGQPTPGTAAWAFYLTNPDCGLDKFAVTSLPRRRGGHSAKGQARKNAM